MPRATARRGLATKHRPKGQVRAEINVTPLVDVVLVLLIIFMVITPMIVRGVSVDLPITSHHDRKNDDNKDLIVSINSSGDVYVNADKIAGRKADRVGPGGAAPLPRQGDLPQGRPPHPLRHRARRDGGDPQGRRRGRPDRHRRAEDAAGGQRGKAR